MRIKYILSFLLVPVLICGFFWLSWTGRLPYPSDITSVEARGQFGDSFGVVNAVISSFALIGLLVTLAMQQKQLTEQGNELKRQAKIDADSRQREEINQYEELLFRLLGFYLDSVDAVSVLRQGMRIEGRQALSQNLQDMQGRLRSRKLNFVPPAVLSRVKQGNATQEQVALFEYISMETFRVIQYSVVYQRRVIASLLTLLRHMEQRCPAHVSVETYRAVVFAQITHVEVTCPRQ